MTEIQKIKEAVELLNKVKLYSNYPFSTKGKYFLALQTLLNLAQEYLKTEGGNLVPEKKEIVGDRKKVTSPRDEYDYKDGWNACRQEMILRRLRGVSVEDLVKIMKKVPHAIKLKNPKEIDWDWEYANFAQAIHKELEANL